MIVTDYPDPTVTLKINRNLFGISLDLHYLCRRIHTKLSRNELTSHKMKRQTERIVPSSCLEQLRTGKVWQCLNLALLVAVMTMTAQTARAEEPVVLPEGTIYVSESGSDENDGISEESAIATLAHAVDIVKARENKTATVYVLNGEYTTPAIDIGDLERVSLSIIGQEKGGVTIHGTGAYIFDIYGDNLVWNFKNLDFEDISSTSRTSAALVLYSKGGNFTVDNCNFRNINSKLGAIAIGNDKDEEIENDNGITNITNCIIENVTGSTSSTAILTVNGDGTYTLDNIEIKNCRLDESVASSTTGSYLRSIIYVNTYEAEVTLSNSRIIENNGPMMSLIESRSKLTIEKTTIADNVVGTYSNGANGGDILIWASNDNSDINISQCTITGNIIAKSGKGLFYNSRSGSINVEYSDISGNTVDAFIGSTGTITANNNWWGTNDQPDTKVDKWVIMNVEADDSDLAENNKLTLTIDFNHVLTLSGEIEELTGGEIPKQSYTVVATAQNGEITPSSVVVNKGQTKSQTFTVTKISDVITLTCDGDAVPITIVSPNIVTQDNFYSFFDEDGSLLNNVTFDELIFQGEFSDLAAGYVIINKPITITGVNAVLKNMGFAIASENVTLDKMTLVANTSIGDLIYVAASKVDLTNLNISYIVGDESADVINVAGYTDVNIKNNSIYFESHATSEVELVTAINLDNVEDVIVDGNTIVASMPGLDIDYTTIVDWDHFFPGLKNVNPVRVLESRGVELTNNNIDVTVNSCDADYPTVQALYIVGSEDILVKGNDFKMVDNITPEGEPIYLYAVQCGFSEGIKFIENNFNISTTGGQSGASLAYVIQTTSTEATFIGNNITCESNCSSLGIYNLPSYVPGEAKDLVIEDNFINVKGFVPESNTWSLLSGIEIETGYATIKNNTIYVQNKGGYIDDCPVSGISAIQYSGTSTLTFDIQANEILVPDGNYAVDIRYAHEEATVTGNTLCAHVLTGNAAVSAVGDNNTINNNHGMTLAAKEVTVDEQENYWTTFYCGGAGFSIDEGENACAYTATVSGETITLHKLGQVIPKNTAVIIVSEDEDINLKISTAGAENEVENDLHGLDVATTRTDVLSPYSEDAAILVLSNKNDDFGFHELATTNVPARKAFLIIDDSDPSIARQFTMVFENATGIQSIDHSPLTIDHYDGAWYSLDGRRLNGKPTAKGVYVKNGKKVVIK